MTVPDLTGIPAGSQQANILITSAGQIGHILETIAHADRSMNIYVHYSEIEAMARELLLLGIVFDRDVSVEGISIISC
jgi:hypothetical protein